MAAATTITIPTVCSNFVNSIRTEATKRRFGGEDR